MNSKGVSRGALRDLWTIFNMNVQVYLQLIIEYFE